MDEILYLEPDEEITSVIDKIKQSKTNRLTLVVPREATLLQSVVNLRLLAKEATGLGKEIALITADKIGRNLAAKVGIVVYDSPKSRQPVFQPPAPVPGGEEIIEINDFPPEPHKEIRPKGVQVHHFQEQPKFKKPLPNAGPQNFRPVKFSGQIDKSKLAKIIYPILGICLLLILIGAFLVLPKVTVRLQVKAENFQKNTEIQLSAATSTNIDSKIFNGQLIDLTQEKEEKFATTGKKNLGGKASGTLTLYNYWDSNQQEISVGTKFSSSSKTFVAKTAVTIPGTSIRGGNVVPGTATLEIEAENPGEEYNVKAGRFTIVGLTAVEQEKIYGQSSQDLTGGFSKEVQVVSQADYDQAKDKITKALREELQQELKTQAKAQEILENALQIETVEETSSAKVDAEAQEFTLKIKERLREIVFDRKDFDGFVLEILEREIPSDKMITLGPNDVISPQIKEKKYDQNLVILDTAVSAKISLKIDIEKVKNNLLGKSRTEAQNYLMGLEGIAAATLQFRPSWWPIKRIPNFARNLEASLDYLEPEVSTPALSPSPAPSPNPTPNSSGVNDD